MTQPLPPSLATAFGQRVMSAIGEGLLLAERAGQRCAGPVLLAGLVLGVGVVELSSGALGQTSRFSLELLLLLLLQLVGPMLVTMIAMALLLPGWLEGTIHWPQRAAPAIGASALVGAVLLLLFLTAAVTGGVLASPRADLLAELREILDGLQVVDLARADLRAAVFLAVLCSWSLLRGGRRLRGHVSPALVSSDLMVEGLTLLLGLKLLWITTIDPLHLSTTPP